MPAPKNLFQEDKEACKAHNAIVNSPQFESSLVFALADYAADSPTAEELKGVNAFIDRFIHFAEQEQEPKNTLSAPRLIPPEQLGSTGKTK